jgi:hypothetical protein
MVSKSNHTRRKYGAVAGVLLGRARHLKLASRVFPKGRDRATSLARKDEVCLIANELSSIFEKQDRNFEWGTFQAMAGCEMDPLDIVGPGYF